MELPTDIFGSSIDTNSFGLSTPFDDLVQTPHHALGWRDISTRYSAVQCIPPNFARQL